MYNGLRSASKILTTFQFLTHASQEQALMLILSSLGLTMLEVA